MVATLHQLTLDLSPEPYRCRYGCGRPATVQVVDRPEQHEHQWDLAARVGADRASVLDLCRPCAGDPAGWDSFITLALAPAILAEAA